MRFVNYGLHPLLIWINKPVTHPVPHQYYQPHHYYHQYCRILTFNCSAKDFFCMLCNISWHLMSEMGYIQEADHMSMWMCQINHQFLPTKPRCWFRYVFSFQSTKYDENWGLNTKLFQKRDVIALKIQYVYSALLWHTVYCCVIQQLVTSDGSDGTQNDPAH